MKDGRKLAAAGRMAEVLVRRRLGARLALAVLLAGCAGANPPAKPDEPPAKKVHELWVEPSNLELALGGSARVEAFPVDEKGEDLEGRTIAWHSSDDAIAMVNEVGLVEARGLGEATITASVDGVEGRARVRVIPASIHRVEIEPASVELPEGRSLRLAATAMDVYGNLVSDREEAWSSSEPSIASVDPDGMLHALAPGEATIRVSVDGVEVSAPLAVLPVPVHAVVIDQEEVELSGGSSLRLGVRAEDEEGVRLPSKEIAWSSSDPDVATVDDDGNVHARSAGEAIITATSEGVSTQVRVVVHAPVIEKVIVTPSALRMKVGDSVAFDALALGEDDRPIHGLAVRWLSLDRFVAEVDGEGVVRAVGAGRTTIRAVVDGVEGASQLVVEPTTPLATLEFELGGDILLGELRTPMVRANDEDGEWIPGWPFELFSSDPSVVEVRGGESLLAVAPGEVQITAAAGGKTAAGRLVVRELRFEKVDVGGSTSCALTSGGEVHCWGAMPVGYSPRPQRIPGPVARYREVSVGFNHICALSEEGAAYCTGGNEAGQLGIGHTFSVSVFLPVEGGLRFREISAGAYYTCAVTTGGEGYCWGANDGGNLGVDEEILESLVPLPVAGGLRFERIHASKGEIGTTCGITPERVPYCWGANASGQMGDGSRTPSTSPVRVGGDLLFSQIHVDSFVGRPRALSGHGCGVTVDGEGRCWGLNRTGELGVGKGVEDSLLPSSVAGDHRFTRIFTSAHGTQGSSSCGIDREARTFCWGMDLVERGKVSWLPAPLEGGHAFASISLGAFHACGITVGGRVHCWGERHYTASRHLDLELETPRLVVGQMPEAPADP